MKRIIALIAFLAAFALAQVIAINGGGHVNIYARDNITGAASPYGMRSFFNAAVNTSTPDSAQVSWYGRGLFDAEVQTAHIYFWNTETRRNIGDTTNAVCKVAFLKLSSPAAITCSPIGGSGVTITFQYNKIDLTLFSGTLYLDANLMSGTDPGSAIHDTLNSASTKISVENVVADTFRSANLANAGFLKADILGTIQVRGSLGNGTFGVLAGHATGNASDTVVFNRSPIISNPTVIGKLTADSLASAITAGAFLLRGATNGKILEQTQVVSNSGSYVALIQNSNLDASHFMRSDGVNATIPVSGADSASIKSLIHDSNLVQLPNYLLKVRYTDSIAAFIARANTWTGAQTFTQTITGAAAHFSGDLGVGTNSPSGVGRVINVYGTSGANASIVAEADSGSNFAEILTTVTASSPSFLFGKYGMRIGYALAKDGSSYTDIAKFLPGAANIYGTLDVSLGVAAGGGATFDTPSHFYTNASANSPALAAFKNITDASTEKVFVVQSYNGGVIDKFWVSANGSATSLGTYYERGLEMATRGYVDTAFTLAFTPTSLTGFNLPLNQSVEDTAIDNDGEDKVVGLTNGEGGKQRWRSWPKAEGDSLATTASVATNQYNFSAPASGSFGCDTVQNLLTYTTFADTLNNDAGEFRLPTIASWPPGKPLTVKVFSQFSDYTLTVYVQDLDNDAIQGYGTPATSFELPKEHAFGVVFTNRIYAITLSHGKDRVWHIISTASEDF